MGNKKWIVCLIILFVFQFVFLAYILNKISLNTLNNSIPLQQISEALDSTYKIIHYSYFKNPEVSNSEIVGIHVEAGSGILLEGGYFLTAGHVVNPRKDEQSAGYTYAFSKYFITNRSFLKLDFTEDEIYKQELKFIFFKHEFGNYIGLDYGLLKLEKDYNLSLPMKRLASHHKQRLFTFYPQGLNILKNEKLKEGLTSVVIGWPLNAGVNVKLGNISWLKSKLGDYFLTFNNSILPGNSGGPMFVVYQGQLYYVAVGISIGEVHRYQGIFDPVVHPSSIAYGIKLTVIIEDLNRELKFGSLDEKISEEIENFLKLNMR